MGLFRDAVDGVDVAGHVGSAGHGHQPDPPGVAIQQPVKVGLVQRTAGVRQDVLHMGHPAPGQVVGVVFHQRGQHHVAGPEGKAVGQLVERLRAVLAEDGRVGGRVRADEAQGDCVGGLVGFRRDLALEAAAAMDAGVPGHEGVDLVQHRAQDGGTGGVVKVDIGARGTVQQGDMRIDADNVLAGGVDGQTSSGLSGGGEDRHAGCSWPVVRPLPGEGRGGYYNDDRRPAATFGIRQRGACGPG